MRIGCNLRYQGNLPALERYSGDSAGRRRSVVVGGDVVPGPMPRETLGRVLDLACYTLRSRHGELAILGKWRARTGSVSYWARPQARVRQRVSSQSIAGLRTTRAGIRAGARALA